MLNILFHSVNICHSGWFKKVADWPIAGNVKGRQNWQPKMSKKKAVSGSKEGMERRR